MSFPLLICSNCEKDVNNDSFLLLRYNNEKELKEVSFTDNNNSTNNYLEIIDYPYSLNNNQLESNNENDLSEQIYYPAKTEEKKIERKFDDFDDDLLDIKPPKLFTKVNKDKIEEKKEVSQPIKTEPEEPKDKILKIEVNNYFSNELNNDKKMYSNKSESLINNDNSIMNNKLLLTNYYKNYTVNCEIPDDVNKIKKNDKESISRNFTDINNNNNSNNKIIGLKVDYPRPDTDSLYFLSNTKQSINILEAEKKQENTNKTIHKENEKKEEKKLFLKKINKIHKDKDNKTKKIIEFNLTKPKTKTLSTYNANIYKLKSKFEKKNKMKNNNDKKQIIEKKKKLTFNSISNFRNRFNLKSKKTSDDVSAFFGRTENYKFTKSNNFLLESIINKKINARNKNIFKSYFENRNKVNKSYIYRAANQTNIFSTKSYTNPFLEVFDYKKK